VKCTAGDLKLANELYYQSRPEDSLRVIDRVLELPPDADTEDIARIVEAALHHTEGHAFERMSHTSYLQDGMAEILVDAAKMPLGGALVPTLMLLRAKCYTDILLKAKTEDVAVKAMANASVIGHLFPGDADLLAVAAQPFSMVGLKDNAWAFLCRALACDPESALLKGTITSLRQAGWDGGELVPEPGYSPPPSLLRDTGEMTPAEMAGPATSLPLDARLRDRRGRPAPTSNRRRGTVMLVVGIVVIVIALLLRNL
jgi:hypothetical protein